MTKRLLPRYVKLVRWENLHRKRKTSNPASTSKQETNLQLLKTCLTLPNNPFLSYDPGLVTDYMRAILLQLLRLFLSEFLSKNITTTSELVLPYYR